MWAICLSAALVMTSGSGSNIDSEQLIVVGRLILGRNTEPFVVGVEGFGHVTLLGILASGLSPLLQ